MIKPLADRIAVRREEQEEVSDGGIIIPDGEQPAIGEVVAVGPGKYSETKNTRIPPMVQVGDTVTFGKMSGTEVKVDDETFWVMFENDIIAVIK